MCLPRQVLPRSFAKKLNTIVSMLSDSRVPSVRARSLIACVHRARRGPPARSHGHAQLTRAWRPAQAPGRRHRRTHALCQGGAPWLRVLALCACVHEATGRPGYLGGQHANFYAFAALKADGSITSWGGNSDGSAFDGDYGAPTDGGYVNVSAAENAFAALKADGSITVWGGEGSGGSADKESESKSIERMFTQGVSMRGLGKSRPDVGASLGERRRCRRDSLSDSAGGGSSMCRTSSSVGIRGARDCSRLDVARASKHQQGERVCGKGHSGGTALRWAHAHASGERP